MTLSNDELEGLARTYKAHTLAAAVEKAAADDVRSRILTELNRRKKESLEVNGVRITRKVRTSRTYSLSALRATLDRPLAKSLIRETVDAAAVRAALRAGQMTEDQHAAIVESESRSAPYVDVDLLT